MRGLFSSIFINLIADFVYICIINYYWLLKHITLIIIIVWIVVTSYVYAIYITLVSLFFQFLIINFFSWLLSGIFKFLVHYNVTVCYCLILLFYLRELEIRRSLLLRVRGWRDEIDFLLHMYGNNDIVKNNKCSVA